jgi:hypothetical protein
MRSDYQTIMIGLDQLFFTPFGTDESVQDRAELIEAFILSNQWTWQEILNEMSKEETNHG